MRTDKNGLEDRNSYRTLNDLFHCCSIGKCKNYEDTYTELHSVS